MIVKMAKIRIVGRKGLLSSILEILQEMGAVHIESEPAELGAIPIPLIRRFTLEKVTQQTREKLETLLEQVKKLLLLLPHPPAPQGPPLEISPAQLPPDTNEVSLKKLFKQLEFIKDRVEVLARKRTNYEDELSLLNRYQKILQVLTPLISMVQESQDLEYMGLTIRAEQRHVIPLLEEAFARLTDDQYEFFYLDVDKETLAGLLVFPKAKAKEIRSLLWEENIGEIRLPAPIAEKPLNEALKIILRKQVQLPGKIGKLDHELTEFSHRWSEPLNQIRQWLENKVQQILVSASFYETKMTFLIYGWIPQKSLPKLQESLLKEFGSRVILEQLPIERSEEDQIPVALVNPSWIRPFEIFTRVLRLPRYGTLDPTPFMAVFFPLFFGIIIGDIGYGLVLLAASLLLRRKYRLNRFVQDMTVIFSWSAVSATLWGIAYGEFFGDLGERMGLHPILINRMEEFPKTILFVLLIGVVHILLGIGLGLFTAIRRGVGREIIGKTTTLVLVIAFLVMIGGIIGWFPKAVISIGLWVFLLGLPVLILGGGPSSTMGLHSLVSILSYLRIVGIGAASMAFALAANKLGFLTKNLALGIAIAALLHVTHLAFGIFSSTIQSLRLHYVEFFENFFEGGGREYRPFQKLA